MDLASITKKILNEISCEIKNEENMNIIKHDILNPIIKNIIDELYPYFLKLSIAIIIIFIFIIIMIFLNLRVVYSTS